MLSFLLNFHVLATNQWCPNTRVPPHFPSAAASLLSPSEDGQCQRSSFPLKSSVLEKNRCHPHSFSSPRYPAAVCSLVPHVEDGRCFDLSGRFFHHFLWCS